MTIRRASAADAPAVLALFDEVIEWFVSIGNLQQWGSEPWSTVPRRITQVTDACALPGAWVAQNEQGEVRAFLALGESMPYVPAPDGPELYVRVLVASRDARVRGIGRRLMALPMSRRALPASTICAWTAMAEAAVIWCASTSPAATRELRRSTWTAGQACCWAASSDAAASFGRSMHAGIGTSVRR